MTDATEHPDARDLLDFIDRSPSPWHAVEQMTRALDAAGASELREEDAWSLAPGGFHYVVRGGSSIVAFRIGTLRRDPYFRVIGAHTDSPGFRVRPSGASNRNGWQTVGVEVYGGPILATFADRDLTVAGRVYLDSDEGPEPTLFHHPAPLLRLPNLAIHLNRNVNEDGLKFDQHEQLPLAFGPPSEEGADADRFLEWLGERMDMPPESIQSWELAVADTQPGAFYGPAGEFIADSQLDNLASCHAALQAFTAVEPECGVSVLAAFDHEEVGSETFKGAAGSFLEDVLDRVAAATDIDRRRAMPRSWLLSADMAHAWHPNFGSYYDELNAPRVNMGPAVKINARQRYATDAGGEAYFQSLCERAAVPFQRYVHRGGLPCGSTIGPMTSARLGMRTVDVGNPMWSMHSLRESAGAADHGYIIRVFREFYGEA